MIKPKDVFEREGFTVILNARRDSSETKEHVQAHGAEVTRRGDLSFFVLTYLPRLPGEAAAHIESRTVAAFAAGQWRRFS